MIAEKLERTALADTEKRELVYYWFSFDAYDLPSTSPASLLFEGSIPECLKEKVQALKDESFPSFLGQCSCGAHELKADSYSDGLGFNREIRVWARHI